MSTANTTIDESKVLDVTLIEPRLKHPTIFEYFDALKPGDSFIIHNDHDPKPVYYQLMGERGNIFTFEYLETGPEHWYIEIKKNAVDTRTGEPTVGDIAAKDYRKAEVFKKMGIDFCCGGEKSLREASSEAGIPVEELEKALTAAESATVVDSFEYDKWPIDFLADFIINTHHQYVKDNAEVINNMAAKVSEHHKANHPELPELATKVHYFLQDIQHHLQKEEEILFPNIKNLAAASKHKTKAYKGMVSGPIQMMKMEHEHSGDDLKLFRKLTNNYTLPADACNSYKYLFDKLQEFEGDFIKHIHLENNILFPKSEKLEESIAV